MGRRLLQAAVRQAAPRRVSHAGKGLRASAVCGPVQPLTVPVEAVAADLPLCSRSDRDRNLAVGERGVEASGGAVSRGRPGWQC